MPQMNAEGPASCARTIFSATPCARPNASFWNSHLVSWLRKALNNQNGPGVRSHIQTWTTTTPALRRATRLTGAKVSTSSLTTILLRSRPLSRPTAKDIDTEPTICWKGERPSPGGSTSSPPRKSQRPAQLRDWRPQFWGRLALQDQVDRRQGRIRPRLRRRGPVPLTGAATRQTTPTHETSAPAAVTAAAPALVAVKKVIEPFQDHRLQAPPPRDPPPRCLRHPNVLHLLD